MAQLVKVDVAAALSAPCGGNRALQVIQVALVQPLATWRMEHVRRVCPTRDNAKGLKGARCEDDRAGQAVLRWLLAALAIEGPRDDGLPVRRIKICPPERG